MTELEKLCQEWGISIESHWENKEAMIAALNQMGHKYHTLKELFRKYPKATSNLRFEFLVKLMLPDGRSHTVPYFAGIGHAEESSLTSKAGTFGYNHLKPNLPTAADVLHCLILDAEAANMTFEQWVDEFGWTDPKTAYSTYQACDTSGKRLIAWLGRDKMEQARKAEH